MNEPLKNTELDEIIARKAASLLGKLSQAKQRKKYKDYPKEMARRRGFRKK